MLSKAIYFFVILLAASVGQAQTISVNFHVGDDSDAQNEHVLASGETAGFVPVDGASWNNIDVGAGAAHNTAGVIFSTTTLKDDMGDASAATISPSTNSSTWFVGYAASSANNASELGLAGNDDDLFNSYLALNGPSGDGSPADAAVLSITGLGASYTTDGYDLIIYSDSDRGSVNNNDRTSSFRVTPAGGSAVTTSIEDNPVNVGDATFDGTYVISNGVAGEAYDNYVVVPALTADSFTLEVTSPDGGRGAISGFQVVARTETDPPNPTVEGPNVILFVVDDMGWADWEKYSDYYETPNMTRLAAQGVEFVNAYASCSVCSPSRASLVTGLSPAAHGITKWIPGNSNNEITNNDEPLSDFNLDLGFHTIGDAMQGAGYETCHMGKWHLGQSGNVSANPLNFGYDINVGGSHTGGPSYSNYANNPNTYPNLDLSINENHLTDHLAAEAANYIESRVDANEKFFLNFNLYAVHTPIQAHPDWINHFQSKPDGVFGHDNAAYASLVRGMDEALGTILDKLEAEGIENDTVVIFTSDHGGLTSPSITSNFPFRGGKGQQWEGGHRVPLIISGPGFQEGVTTEHQSIGHDLYPTILEMAGVEGDADHNELVEGLSLMQPVLNPALDRGEPVFWHFPHESNHSGGPYGAVVSENYKFIEVYDTGELLLFDLAVDIGEQQNVITSNPALAGEMRQALHDYLREHDSVLWGGQFQLLPASVLLGDVDLNGVVNFADISPFIARLSSGIYQAEADCDENGVVNFSDISSFITILSGS